MAYGRYFEEFTVGEVLRHWPGRTINEADCTWFALLTMNQHPVHSDAHYAATHTQHGQRLVLGPLVFSIGIGMTVADVSGKAIANLEIEKITHEAPTFIGDTLYSESTVLETRESKQGDRGTVTVQTRVSNQRGERVMTFKRTALLPKKNHGDPGRGRLPRMTRAPLDGLRVLAVSQFGAGPFGTQLLADLGAEVIKIEDPRVGGDVAREVGPYAGEDDSLYFQAFNRGKKSITLDLEHPEGRAVLRDLARVSHAVYNNLRGDLPERLGVTYAALRDVNPALVCCSLSGFGRTGPRAAEPAFDYLIQGYAGWMSVSGEPDGPPGKCGVSVVDFAGGYASMAALLAGLWDAQRTGVGRDIELSLLDTAVSMLSYYAIWALNRDWQPARVEDSGHQSIVPAQNFPTRDGFIVIFCNKEKFWTSLVQAMDLPEVARDPRFATFADRLAHKSVLVPILKARFAERTTSEWLSRLRGKVPCAPVNTIAEALADEQVAARDMIVEVKHPRFGVLREVGSPVKTEGAAPNLSPAPALGQHTDEILRTLLQYDPARIAALRASGALGEPND